MAVPDYQTFMRPLLLLAADGMEHGINNAIGELAEEFGLSEADRSQLLPSGLGSVLANRVSWAKTYLMKAGALEDTKSTFLHNGSGKGPSSRIPRWDQFADFAEVSGVHRLPTARG